MDKSVIIEKIKNILAKADPSKNDSLAEIEVALATAQRLALKYGIDLDSIGEDKPEDVVSKVVDLGTKSTPSWASILVNIVAKNHRCKCYKQVRRDDSDLILMGLERDVDVAMVVALYTVGVARVMWEKYLKVLKSQGKSTTRSESLRYRNDYMDGFASGINENYKKNVQEYGLVPATPGIVQQKFEAMTLHQESSSRSRMGDWGAYNQGYKDGREVSSRKPLEAC